MKFVSKTGTELENPKAEYKNASHVGRYKLSDKVWFMPDNSYVCISDVTSFVQDKGSVHVTGCCAGGVMVDRIILSAGSMKFVFLFDTKKEVEKALGLLEKING